ncbi:MAG: hypothetical protein ABI072_09435 [Edaphobacter sp.]
MDDAKLIEMAEDVAALKVGLASIEDKLDSLIHTLMGNGQPGVITTLDKRLSRAENRNQWLAGLWVGASSVVVVVFTVVKYYFHR